MLCVPVSNIEVSVILGPKYVHDVVPFSHSYVTPVVKSYVCPFVIDTFVKFNTLGI